MAFSGIYARYEELCRQPPDFGLPRPFVVIARPLGFVEETVSFWYPVRIYQGSARLDGL